VKEKGGGGDSYLQYHLVCRVMTIEMGTVRVIGLLCWDLISAVTPTFLRQP
jgi:hypothetical protein